MAQRKQHGRFRLRTWVMLAALPVMLWAAAFVLWLYWPDFRGWYSAPEQDQRSRPSERAARGSGREPAREKISDDERKKLEEVLRRRN
jgi:hypothetical protein